VKSTFNFVAILYNSPSLIFDEVPFLSAIARTVFSVSPAIKYASSTV